MRTSACSCAGKPLTIIALTANASTHVREACLAAGLAISGINAEVMPGQWEFQVGPVGRGPLKEIVYQDRWGQPYAGV